MVNQINQEIVNQINQMIGNGTMKLVGSYEEGKTDDEQ